MHSLHHSIFRQIRFKFLGLALRKFRARRIVIRSLIQIGVSRSVFKNRLFLLLLLIPISANCVFLLISLSHSMGTMMMMMPFRFLRDSFILLLLISAQIMFKFLALALQKFRARRIVGRSLRIGVSR